MAMPVTRYAKSGDVHIAYQVFGSGPIDLVVIPGFVSHIETYWDQPDLARWLLRLSSFARVAIFQRWRNLLESHHTIVRRELARFRGNEVRSLGDGFLATFD